MPLWGTVSFPERNQVLAILDRELIPQHSVGKVPRVRNLWPRGKVHFFPSPKLGVQQCPGSLSQWTALGLVCLTWLRTVRISLLSLEYTVYQQPAEHHWGKNSSGNSPLFAVWRARSGFLLWMGNVPHLSYNLRKTGLGRLSYNAGLTKCG